MQTSDIYDEDISQQHAARNVIDSPVLYISLHINKSPLMIHALQPTEYHRLKHYSLAILFFSCFGNTNIHYLLDEISILHAQCLKSKHLGLAH